MIMRLIVISLAALSVAFVLAACSADEVVADQCLNEAERIEDPTTRAAAEEACEAARDGDVSADDAKRAARRRCLQAAEGIANDQARRDAERRCEDIR